jgi:polyphosphate glucokinase
MHILGIDIGGSGIKGAPVDVETGVLLRERYRLPTPEPAKPKGVIRAVETIAYHFDWKDPIGAGFPGVVLNGVTMTAVNLHPDWVGLDAAKRFRKATGCPVTVLNDADAAGLAEMAFGAGRGKKGVVLVVTIGTGLGTALFTDGVLVPNCELGHIEVNGMDAELRASDAIRKAEKLSWKKWGRRFNRYLQALEKLFSPNLIILGGGASKKLNRFGPCLDLRADIVPAEMLNEAGIVGAALAASLHVREET